MLKKILVALDRSQIAKQVFEEALALAKGTQANLLLLHVLSPTEEGSPYLPMLSNMEYYPGFTSQSFELYQKQWDSFKNEGVEILQSFSAQANTIGISTEFTQIVGHPGPTICKIATTWDADLIIMGRRGRSGLAELFLGSVSNYVLHHAPCSVHIVHHPISVQNAEKVVVETTNNF
ncbi:universal stress protein [Dendronalium sp. ChiSLP03b]|uniref:universal stress protein n=1 Tax=Dendronalium sp. ChiSLP03b TaxID=3075381 RepID=UPI002AD5413C|nr:universal stress protein [Dendronalium sp. ChiSLP03b]MDZ8203918.1 universal stress protein [Dendronalium sp. ChiSLP03b]